MGYMTTLNCCRILSTKTVGTPRYENAVILPLDVSGTYSEEILFLFNWDVFFIGLAMVHTPGC